MLSYGGQGAPADTSRGSRLNPWVDLGLILAGLSLLAKRPSSPVAYDAYARYQALLQFVRTGHPVFLKYSFIGPLFASPLWYLGRVFPTPGSEWFVMRFNLLVFALLLMSLWLMLRRRLDRQLVRTFLLILVVASLFAFATQDFLGEMFTVALVGLGALLVCTGPGLVGWLSIAVGVANTPGTALGLLLAVFHRSLKRRRVRYFGTLLVAVGLVYLDLQFRGFNFLRNPYAQDSNGGVHTVMPYSGGIGFSYPLALGLMSVLVSFGKGLFFFTPGLLIPARQILRRLDVGLASTYHLWQVFLAGMVLSYSAWWAWYGGFTWGPRFFLLASLPASLALATRLQFPPRHRAALAGILVALALSWWVGVNGVVWGDYGQETCMANNYALEHLCWYTPEFSVLWRPFVLPKPSYSHFEMAYLAYSTLTLLWLSRTLLKPLWLAARLELVTALAADEADGVWRQRQVRRGRPPRYRS